MHKFITKPRLIVAAVVATLFGLFTTGPASAATTVPDPTDGAMADIQEQISGWVTAYGLPALVALLGLGLVIAILVRFARKGATKVTG